MKNLNKRISKLKSKIESLNRKFKSQLETPKVDRILLMHKAGK